MGPQPSMERARNHNTEAVIAVLMQGVSIEFETEQGVDKLTICSFYAAETPVDYFAPGQEQSMTGMKHSVQTPGMTRTINHL